uniref:Exoglucanase S n=1 Tax=Clostridium cellulovorans TaxID=1493 RepID=O65986_CLOCL|nr:exoglucanase S [Clostridium cellulovorans]
MRKRLNKIVAVALTATTISSVAATVNTAQVSAAPVVPNNEYVQHFKDMYAKIHNANNGYFSDEGIPYHAVETLMVEAPDYGHETTSEAFSYYMWLEAMNAKLTGDFSGFKKAWDVTEKYIIPGETDQPSASMSNYDPNKPATYAAEHPDPSMYPSQLQFGAAVGKDPLYNELKSTYGTSQVYGMHWLLDVDNWYGFGGATSTSPVYINTFQRGVQESCWETVPQPCKDEMKYGGRNGFLDLFTGDSQYATQFKYTNAPDADARAVQATYYAQLAAKEWGVDISSYVAKSTKMGDFLRYSFFDKYFRKVGNSTQAGTGYDSAQYLLNWYYAWGGGISSNWSWRIGSSHNHFGYQNPMAAWILSNTSDFKPKSPNAATDWNNSLKRQIEFYQWLQSAEGGIAGGASNSNGGSYQAWPAGTRTFYGMGYTPHPVYEDPGSNEWFGMQAWSMQRVAEYYYSSKDPAAKSLLDKWAKWACANVQFDDAAKKFKIPAKLVWTGQPDTWTGSYTGNSNLHVKVEAYGEDLGVAGSLSNALSYYAKALESSTDAADKVAYNTAKETSRKILDYLWASYQDDKGIAVTETRNDFKRFNQSVYIPSGWTGKMPNGDVIQSGATFLSIRSKYKQDPSWPNVEAALANGTGVDMTYHRFWGQSDIAIAFGTYGTLFTDPTPGLKGDVNSDAKVNAIDLAILKKYILDSTTKINTANSDMNGDGKVNAMDLALLKKALLA